MHQQLLDHMALLLVEFDKDFPEVDSKLLPAGLGDSEKIRTRWLAKGRHSRYAHITVHRDFRVILTVGRKADAYGDGVEFRSTVWIRSEDELRSAAAVMYNWVSL